MVLNILAWVIIGITFLSIFSTAFMIGLPRKPTRLYSSLIAIAFSIINIFLLIYAYTPR